MLDCCAQIAGLSRSAYVRKITLSHIRSEMAEKSISNTEKIIRETMETILDIKTKNEAKTHSTFDWRNSTSQFYAAKKLH